MSSSYFAPPPERPIPGEIAIQPTPYFIAVWGGGGGRRSNCSLAIIFKRRQCRHQSLHLRLPLRGGGGGIEDITVCCIVIVGSVPSPPDPSGRRHTITLSVRSLPPDIGCVNDQPMTSPAIPPCKGGWGLPRSGVGNRKKREHDELNACRKIFFAPTEGETFPPAAARGVHVALT